MKKYTQLNIRNAKYPKATKTAARKMKIKKGDTVMVVSGKDKGKTGKVLHAYPKTGKVVVEGAFVHKRHTKKQGGQTGRIIERPMPINASNVMVVDPDTKKPSRVKRVVNEAGKRVRASVKSGTVLA